MAEQTYKPEPGEVLVAILKSVSDFTILQEQGWYRIPVATAPKRWPPKWLAFYQPKAFKENAYRIQFWGEVAEISQATGRELFPNRTVGPKAEKEYYRLELRQLNELATPIPSKRPRRLVFIPTTKYKFDHAEQINDLFHHSPLEDDLWGKFKELDISAERQWFMPVEKRYYLLDFALFCNRGFIDIETDGDWHYDKAQARKDKVRNNALASRGWQVLRFDGSQITEQMESYCIPEIQKTIEQLDGLSDDGLVPRKFYTESGVTVQQLSMFERKGPYHLNPEFDSGAEVNLEIEE